MSEHEELIANLRRLNDPAGEDDSITTADAVAWIDAAADALEAATKPRTVSTVEELDVLPVGAIVLTGFGQGFERVNANTWMTINDGRRYFHDDFPLPARVLYTPTDAGSN